MGLSLEDGYRSFKGFDPIITSAEHSYDIFVKKRDEVANPIVECSNKGVNSLFGQENGRRLESIGDLLLINDNVYSCRGR